MIDKRMKRVIVAAVLLMPAMAFATPEAETPATAQVVVKKCYLQDANRSKIVLAVMTSKDLHSRFTKPGVEEFICEVASKFSTSQRRSMAARYFRDTVTSLGLPSSSIVMSVNIGPIE